MLLRAASLGLVLLAGCGPHVDSESSAPQSTASTGSHGVTCPIPYLGSPTEDIQLELVALGPSGEPVPLEDKGSVSLILAPQGGRVAFVGVRATNVSPCGATITGALRDPSTSQLRLDARTVNLASSDGVWGGSVAGDIASYSNIPVCPNQWASTDVYGHEFELSVTLEDRDRRTATRIIRVTPACDEVGAESECTCICRADYNLGQACDSLPGEASAP